jgi:lysophospholipase L1-like esterase
MRTGSRRTHLFRASVLAVGVWLLVALAAPAVDRDRPNEASKPAPRKDAWWMKIHEGFLRRAEKGDVNVLFLGDSITQGWGGAGKEVWKERYEPLKAANFGIGGDQTQHVLWRITEGKELEGIHPKAIVLMIGTNNMGRDTAEDIAAGVTAIVEALRHKLPEAKVLLLGIFPRSPEPIGKFRDKIKETNQRIAKLDDGKHVRYLDIGDKFLDAEGRLHKEIMPDYLHLSPKGYKIWADAIGPALEEMTKGS